MDTTKNRGMKPKLITALSELPAPSDVMVTPVADIFELADVFVIKLDMPGATKDTINVVVEPGYLAAKGAVVPHHPDTATLLLAEIPRRSYFRQFNLGQGASHENVQAKFEDGVLLITVPKTEEAKLKQIEVNVK